MVAAARTARAQSQYGPGTTVPRKTPPVKRTARPVAPSAHFAAAMDEDECRCRRCAACPVTERPRPPGGGVLLFPIGVLSASPALPTLCGRRGWSAEQRLETLPRVILCHAEGARGPGKNTKEPHSYNPPFGPCLDRTIPARIDRVSRGGTAVSWARRQVLP